MKQQRNDWPWPLFDASGNAYASAAALAHAAASALADADDGVTLLLFDRPPADGEALHPVVSVAIRRPDLLAAESEEARAG